jgi:hypothetical protein
VTDELIFFKGACCLGMVFTLFMLWRALGKKSPPDKDPWPDQEYR